MHKHADLALMNMLGLAVHIWNLNAGRLETEHPWSS